MSAIMQLPSALAGRLQRRKVRILMLLLLLLCFSGMLLLFVPGPHISAHNPHSSTHSLSKASLPSLSRQTAQVTTAAVEQSAASPFTGSPAVVAKTQRARVAVYVGPGTTARGVRNFVTVLGRYFEVSKVSPQEVKGGLLSEGEFSLLVMPGGAANTMASGLGFTGLTAVRRFLSDGGGYLGVCAGGYLTAWGTMPPWKASDDALSAFVTVPKPRCSVSKRCVQKGAVRGRGVGGVRVRPATELLPLLSNASALEGRVIAYRGGPVFDTPKDTPRAAASHPQVLAHFVGSVPLEADLVARGYPPAVSGEGLAFAVASEYGRGTVVALGPHPEQDAGDHRSARRGSPEEDLLLALARYAMKVRARLEPRASFL